MGAFQFILFVLCGIENMDLFHKFTIPINPLLSLSLGLVLTLIKINSDGVMEHEFDFSW